MTARSRRFTRPGLGGVALHALHRGDPSHPTLVLLHGGAANVHWWEPLAEALATRHHVVALDFRGHGDSDFPEALVPGAFSLDLEALLAELGGPPPILIGHSLGGRVARGAAAPAREATRRALGIRRTYRTREQAIARFRFLPPAPLVPEERRRTIAARSVQELEDGRFGFKFDPRWFGVPSRPLPPLGRVSCPCLVVRGSESTLLTEAGAQELAAAIPGATLVVVPGAGHHVHLDRPDAVHASLEAFLATL